MLDIFKKFISWLGRDLPAHAIHVQNHDDHAVCIGSLRVLITQHENEWIAQGIEIDYAASGSSLNNVKDNFQNGLALTIEEHLKAFGTIEHLLKHAPVTELRKLKYIDVHTFGMVSFHDLAELQEIDRSAPDFPYNSIAYLKQKDEQLVVA